MKNIVIDRATISLAAPDDCTDSGGATCIFCGPPGCDMVAIERKFDAQATSKLSLRAMTIPNYSLKA
jgi:hypothetical protein